MITSHENTVLDISTPFPALVGENHLGQAVTDTRPFLLISGVMPCLRAFLGGSDSKDCLHVRRPGEGNGYPLWYSCLENPVDRGAWQAAVLGVAKSRT